MPPAPKRYPWQRKRLRLLLLLSIPVAIIIGYAVYRGQVSQQLRERVAAAEAEGWPTTLESLDQWQEPVPDEENAAPLLLEAVGTLQAPPPEWAGRMPVYSDTEFERTQPLSPELARAMLDFLKSNGPVLQSLHQALPRPQSRYPLLDDSGELTVEGLPQLEEGMKLLATQAILAAERGNLPQSARSLRAVLAMGESLRAVPIMEVQLVRFRAIDYFEYAMERVLNRAQLPEPEIQLLLETVRSIDLADGIRRGMAGNVTQAMLRMPHYANDTFLLWSGVLDRNALGFFELVSASKTLHELPPADAAQEWVGLNARQRLRGLFLIDNNVHMALGMWPKAALQLATTQVALLVEAQVWKQGTPPLRIDALVPGPTVLPADPFAEEPLKYQFQEGSYLVYSNGPGEAGENEGRIRRWSRTIVRPEDLVIQVSRWQTAPAPEPAAPAP